ncbi:MAG: M13 family metallopeptidase [Rickettsiales bacterium]|jgi:putative endopeptidase|nr:M13 family metallopeptidase [Rickettsiales bacterium]
MKKWKLNLICGICAAGICAALFCIKNHKEKDMNINIENMDLTVRPGDDFYSFAGAGWRKNNPLTGEFARFGVFDKLREENLKQVQEIIQNSDNEKIRTLYNSAMDEKKLNADGLTPVAADFAKIDSVKTRDDLPEFLGREIYNDFWGESVQPDLKKTTHYIFGISQPGFGLPDRDYYFDNDTHTKAIREKYKKYMADALAAHGLTGSDRVYALEERFAKVSYPKEKLRDPEKNYHKLSRAEFVKKYKSFDFESYFSAQKINPQNIDVNQPEPFAESLKVLESAPLSDILLYMKWNVINSAMPYLNDAAYDLYFDFYGKTMSGKTEQRPRWKRSVQAVNGSLGEIVGQAYVQKYFPAAAKDRMVRLVENLRGAYAMRIRNLEWMSDATKEKALEKLAAFGVKIGYPDKWRDYSKLEIKNDSYWENIKRVGKFEDDFWNEKIDQPVDKSIWFMNAHEVNAYYDPSTNEICFPAGILQPPFFDMNAADAFNYGAIGSVIGHEMTHGFDDEGRKFDKDGNMKDWWAPSDSAAFDKQAAVMEKFFDAILVAPDLHANGKFTLGENLADYGGITIAFDAYKLAGSSEKISGNWTAAQVFFLAYAGTENQNIRPEEVARLTKTDPHSLSELRVNGILPHIDAWYSAFGITPTDKLYLAPENRVRIW